MKKSVFLLVLLAACGGSSGAGGSGGSAGSGGSGASGGTGGSAGGGGSGGTVGQPGPVELIVDDYPPVELRSHGTLNVRVIPHGLTSKIVLGVQVPDDITAEISPTELTLQGDVESGALVKTTTAANSRTGDHDVTITATPPSGEPVVFKWHTTVEAAITITIPRGIQPPGGMDVFGDYPTTLRALDGMSAENPIRIRFFNDDTVAHRVEGSQAGHGFGVTPPPGIPPNSYESPERLVDSPGTYDFYLHDLGPDAGTGRIVIQ